MRQYPINLTEKQWQVSFKLINLQERKRWIVERSFSWLENFRRLTIDHEFLAEIAETIVQIAFI